MNTQNLTLDMKHQDGAVSLREKLEANYWRNIANKTNRSNNSQFPSPTPSHHRLMGYNLNDPTQSRFLSPQNFATSNKFNP